MPEYGQLDSWIEESSTPSIAGASCDSNSLVNAKEMVIAIRQVGHLRIDPFACLKSVNTLEEIASDLLPEDIVFTLEGCCCCH